MLGCLKSRPCGRQFSAISRAHPLSDSRQHVCEYVSRRSCSLQGRWPEQCHRITTPPSTAKTETFWTRIVGKRLEVNIPGTEDLFFCLFQSWPRVWLTVCSFWWQCPTCRDQEINRSLFRGCPWNPQKICAISREAPWDAPKLQLPLSKQWIMWRNLLQIKQIT